MIHLPLLRTHPQPCCWSVQIFAEDTLSYLLLDVIHPLAKASVHRMWKDGWSVCGRCNGMKWQNIMFCSIAAVSFLFLDFRFRFSFLCPHRNFKVKCEILNWKSIGPKNNTIIDIKCIDFVYCQSSVGWEGWYENSKIFSSFFTRDLKLILGFFAH